MLRGMKTHGRMGSLRIVGATAVACALAGCDRPAVPASAPVVAVAAAIPPGSTDAQGPSADGHDGQHDFDFLIGKWRVQLRRLKNPLHGSHEWIEGTGTADVRPLWNGKATIDEVEVDMPTGHFEGLTLRVYSPTTRQWGLYWANQKKGQVELPTIGQFKDGRGEFFDQEPYEGRSILVRYVWYNITRTSCDFEQSFSDDIGKTWEPNWTTHLTRIE
jgi:hypothetical protein